MASEEAFFAMTLTRVNFFSLPTLLQLYRKLGSAAEVVAHHDHIRDVVPEAHPRLVEALADLSEAMKRAEAELEYDNVHGIRAICYNDEDYPARLRECNDAPLVLYYRGTADLNQRHVLNIIGTRNSTAYGQDLIRRFCEELRQLCPQVLIVSGLAYGIDICAHRQALLNGFETVGVVAHGLDDLYPSLHRETANEMVRHGGLLTEYMTQTQPYPQNFVQRNRIVAGLSDACLVVESAAKGGALITAGIARSYDREVFAFPGNVGSRCSEGCNKMIRNNEAALVTSAKDLVQAAGWTDDSLLAQARQEGIERDLFPQLSPEARRIVDILKRNNDLQVNTLSVQTNLPISRLTALLFELEMKGVVSAFAGGVYHLLT